MLCRARRPSRPRGTVAAVPRDQRDVCERLDVLDKGRRTADSRSNGSGGLNVGFASRPFSRLTTAVSSPATKPPGEAASRSSILPSRRHGRVWLRARGSPAPRWRAHRSR
jgi:hypothetical protein